jgi:hypothetical protein
MGRQSGRANGEYSWQEADWAYAYLRICAGKTHNSIIAEAVKANLPHIANHTLMFYMELFCVKFNYPPPQKGLRLPWEGFNYDGSPLWDEASLRHAFELFNEGIQNGAPTPLDIIQEAVANGLPKISPMTFRKYMFLVSKELGRPFPRKA